MKELIKQKISQSDKLYKEMKAIVETIKKQAEKKNQSTPNEKYNEIIQQAQSLMNIPETYVGDHRERAIIILSPTPKELEKIYANSDVIDTIALPTMPRQRQYDSKRIQYFALNLTFQLKIAKKIRQNYSAEKQQALPRKDFAKKIYDNTIQNLKTIGAKLKVKKGTTEGTTEADRLPIVMLEYGEKKQNAHYQVNAKLYNNNIDPAFLEKKWFEQ